MLSATSPLRSHGPRGRGRAECLAGNRIAQLIVDLDDRSFRTREAAQAELVRLGRVAEPAVRQALGRATSAEQKGWLESLVARFDQGLSAGELRLRRAVQALAWSRDPGAVPLLREWASGMAGAQLTDMAQVALDARVRRP